MNEEQKIELKAPSGDYLITVKASEFNESFSGIRLTGGVVGARAVNDFERNIAIGIFFLMLVLSAIFLKWKLFDESFKKSLLGVLRLENWNGKNKK